MKSIVKHIRIIHFLGDLFLLNFSFFIALGIKFNGFNIDFKELYFNLLLFTNLSWFITALVVKSYSIHRVIRIERIYWNMIKHLLLHILVVTLIIAVAKYHFVSRKQMLLHYIIFLILLVPWKVIFLSILKYYRKKGESFRKIIIIGTGKAAYTLKQFLTSDISFGYKFLGFFDDDPKINRYSKPLLGSIADVKEFALQEGVTEIYCALPSSRKKQIKDFIQFCDSNLIRFKILPDILQFISRKVSVDFYGLTPVMLLRKEPLENYSNSTVKRIFDILFSLFVICLVFPWLFPLLAILIKISSPGPVFFKQLRSGKNNSIFTCWKFRTMKLNIEADSRQASYHDERILKVGRFLRKTNLDELPQFFNVLWGDMSVVGPRPHMLSHTDQYSRIINKFMVRHLIKPGITGWAQVHGLRGSTEAPEQMIHRVEHDVWYIENWSLILDLKIIALTILKMLKGDNKAF